jgi:arylformamidase
MVNSPDPFMIRAHVPGWEADVADYKAASDRTRAAFPDRRTVGYGAEAEEILDLYYPAGAQPRKPRPIHLIVHGGYWRPFSKDDYAFVADAITAAGAIAAIMDYSLMPVSRMETLVGQVRRAAHWLERQADTFGGDPRALSASGHSAGAHLASFLACRADHERGLALPRVQSVLLLSGIYDLDPIARSYLQPELQLTGEEVTRWSPLDAAPASDVGINVLVGEKETEPFHTQAAAFAAHLARAGVPGRLATVRGEDHMTIVREFGRPGSVCASHLAATIEASRQE